MTELSCAPQQPRLSLIYHHADGEAGSLSVGFTVINYNNSALTHRCVLSLINNQPPPRWVFVLDNASGPEDYAALERSLPTSGATEVRLYRSEANLGFAEGSNFLVSELLALPTCEYLGLLNNDAVAQPQLVSDLLQPLHSQASKHGMSGGRMHKLLNPDEPDTLGIAIYKSLMPADRLETTDVYLGPTGGCCMISRQCAQDVIQQTGYFYDPRYFCYCEDTDLALRVNLLGYRPAYVDKVVALHQGQASSGKAPNDFIAYHGWRNVMWMHLKLLPASLLWRHLIWLLVAHGLSIGRHLLSGHVRLLWRVYRDGFKPLPRLLEERAQLKKLSRIAPAELRGRFDAKFYRRGYLMAALRQMWAPFRVKISKVHQDSSRP